MNVGIIGYPLSGKTTLHRAVCTGHRSGDLGSVIVPDERFDYIVKVTKPKKVSPQHVEFVDNAARIEPRDRKGFSGEFFANARKVDVLLHIVRAFDNPIAPYHTEIDPLRDQRQLNEELILADLQVIENRMARMEKIQATHQSGTPEQNEWRVLEKLKAALEEEQPIRSVELGEEEMIRMRGYQFLSAKTLICVANIDESAIEQGENSPELKPLKDYCAERGIQFVALCASIEKEISDLEVEDQGEFLESLGLTVPASHRLIRAAFDALGLITFFTVGESEVRAWPLRKGETAQDAAGTIHTDLARGFIRAEVTHYKEMHEFGGLDPATKAGKMKLEGKEYIVLDGDTVHIRHNM